MTAILALFSGAWPAILGAVLAATGVVFGLFKHQEAKTATAQAATATETAKAATQQRDSAVADVNAARAAVTAVQGAAGDRQKIDASVAPLVNTPGAVEKALVDQGLTQ